MLLAERLQFALAALSNDSFLLMTIASSPRYLQFVEFDGAIRGESIGDQYIEGDAQLSTGDRAWLLAHGWNEPDEGGNYWRHWDPADPDAASTVAVVTLFSVHGVTDAGDLMFKSDDPTVLAELFENR